MAENFPVLVRWVHHLFCVFNQRIKNQRQIFYQTSRQKKTGGRRRMFPTLPPVWGSKTDQADAIEARVHRRDASVGE